MKDKVVVIGGAGFIGSHVGDELSRRGYRVTILDCRASPWIREDQEMVVGDMLDQTVLEEAINGAKYLYHFGGVADIGEAIDRPFDTIKGNVLGTAAALEVSSTIGVKRFLYASTMYVYSSSGSFYRATKQASECIIEAYAERFDLDYTLLRYGSLYGPRAQDWNGLKKFVNQIIREGRVNYPGTGKERREYVHVIDAARLSVDVLSEKYRNEAITITGTQTLNSRELIELILSISGISGEVEFDINAGEFEHYGITPYRYTPKRGKKLVPQEFVDLGEGVLELIEEIHRNIDDD